MSEKDLELYESENIDSLERDFNNVMSYLLANENLSKFASNYRKLHDAFIESHRNNAELVEKCMLLNTNILQNSTKVNSVMALSQEDQRIIAGLKFEFEKAWKMVELSQEKEQRSNEIIAQMKDEVKKLGRAAEQAAIDKFTYDNSFDDINNVTDILRREMSLQRKQIEQLQKESKEWREKAAQITEYMEECENELEKSSAALNELKNDAINVENEVKEIFEQRNQVKQEIAASNEEISSYPDKKKEIEDNMKQIAIQKENRKQDLNDLLHEKENFVASIEVARQTLEAKKQINENTLKEIDTMKESIQTKEDFLKTYDGSTKKALSNVKEQEKELKRVRQRSNKIKEEIKMSKERMSQCTDEIIRLQHELLKAESENIYLKREISLAKHLGSIEKREVVTQYKNLQTEERITTDALNDMASIKYNKHKIQVKWEAIMKTIQKHKEETTNLNSSTNTVEIFTKTAREQLSENEMKLNIINDQIQNYETQSKILVEERDITRHQIEQINAERETLNHTNTILMNVIQNGKQIIRDKDMENIKIHQKCEQIKEAIPKMEKERKMLRKRLKQIERDISQKYCKLVRTRYFMDVAETNLRDVSSVVKSLNSQTLTGESRNNFVIKEVKTLREKANAIKWTIISKSQQFIAMSQKVTDLKSELIKLVKKKKELLTSCQHRDVLFREYIQSQKALLRLQGKATALEEEFNRPINVHRWLFLEGTNPEQLNLIKMTMGLRSKLMVKLSTIKRLKNDLEMAKEDYKKIKRHAKKRTKADNEMQISFYNDILVQKTHQIKVIETSVSQQNPVVDEGKETVVGMRSALRDTKAEYFALKKRTDDARASLQIQRVSKLLPPAKPRFVAGGFMTSTLKSSSRSTVSEDPNSRLMMSTLRSSLIACPMQSVSESKPLPSLKPVLI